jgi:hypothetical protein
MHRRYGFTPVALLYLIGRQSHVPKSIDLGRPGRFSRA